MTEPSPSLIPINALSRHLMQRIFDGRHARHTLHARPVFA